MIGALAEWRWYLAAAVLLAAGLAVDHYGNVRYEAGGAACVKADAKVEDAQVLAVNAENAAAIAKTQGAENAESKELNAIADLELQPFARPVVRLCVGPPAADSGAVPASAHAPATQPAAGGALRGSAQPARGDPDVEPKLRALMHEADVIVAQCRALDAAAP